MSVSSVPRYSSTCPALVQEGSLRMAPILGVPRLLQEMGLDAGSVIAEADLDPALFDDPENTVPFADMGRFLASVRYAPTVPISDC